MTESEAIEKLRAYAKCQSLQVKGIYEDCNNEICDNRDLCYMQGTAGEHCEAIDIAIQALEKQAPRKVYTFERAKDFIEYVCPVCQHFLATEMVGEGRYGAQVAYCSGCGQRLDWSSFVRGVGI